MQLTDKQKYQLLLEIAQKVGDTLDLDEIMDHLLDAVRTVVDYNAVGIFVLNQDLVHGRNKQPKEVIAGIARRGFDTKPSELDPMLTLGKGIVGHVIRTNSSVVVPDITLDPHYIEGRKSTRSEIAVPIVRKGRAVGALNLESDQPSSYGESDLEVLQFFADAAAISIEKAMLHRQLLEKEVVDKQLELARDLQRKLFPSEPPQIPGFDIAGICLPAERIGGDYYDFIDLPGGELGLAVADVSGNGITAAMFMTALRGLLRTNACNTLKPGNIARKINRELPNFTSASHFVSAAYAVLNPTTDELVYVSCGHPPAMVVRGNGSTLCLMHHGPVLGIFQKASFPTEKVTLMPGDILVLYTDGVIELRGPEGVEFGMNRLADTVQQHRERTAQGIIQAIIQATRQFSGSEGYEDDFTLLVVKRK